MDLKRTDVLIKPNNARVLVRPFEFADSQRALRIVARVMSLTEEEVDRLVADLFTEFHGRHQKARQFILHRFEYARQFLLTDAPLSENRQLLLGGYFTQEYALESAALFNPSMVWHPDQSGVAAGSKRFIVSLRATGEGHVSSITFRSGIDRPQLPHRARPDAAVRDDARHGDRTRSTKRRCSSASSSSWASRNGFVEQVMTLLDDIFRSTNCRPR